MTLRHNMHILSTPLCPTVPLRRLTHLVLQRLGLRLETHFQHSNTLIHYTDEQSAYYHQRNLWLAL